MRTTGRYLPVLTIGQLVLGLVIAGESRAYYPDRDYPFAAAAAAEYTEDGNPLADGDWIYNVRLSHRLLSGHFGLEGNLGYAEPSGRGKDADLLLLDLSVVWFMNYSQQEKIWESRCPIKYEFILYTGPGVASLSDHDPRFAAESGHFFTWNAGLGVNLFWKSRDPAGERRTSHWHLRPEVRGRWFGSGEDSFDWGFGLMVGYGFGKRSSCGALKLQVDKVEEFIPQLLEGNLTAAAATYKSVEQHLEELVDLKARVSLYGPKCRVLKDRLNVTIDRTNRNLTALRRSVGSRSEE